MNVGEQKSYKISIGSQISKSDLPDCLDPIFSWEPIAGTGPWRETKVEPGKEGEVLTHEVTVASIEIQALDSDELVGGEENRPVDSRTGTVSDFLKQFVVVWRCRVARPQAPVPPHPSPIAHRRPLCTPVDRRFQKNKPSQHRRMQTRRRSGEAVRPRACGRERERSEARCEIARADEATGGGLWSVRAAGRRKATPKGGTQLEDLRIGFCRLLTNSALRALQKLNPRNLPGSALEDLLAVRERSEAGKLLVLRLLAAETSVIVWGNGLRPAAFHYFCWTRFGVSGLGMVTRCGYESVDVYGDARMRSDLVKLPNPCGSDNKTDAHQENWKKPIK